MPTDTFSIRAILDEMDRLCPPTSGRDSGYAASLLNDTGRKLGCIPIKTSILCPPNVVWLGTVDRPDNIFTPRTPMTPTPTPYTPPALSTYSTEELRRLTTLTEATAKCGEFLTDRWGVVFKTEAGVTWETGGFRCEPAKNLHERRVRSFTDRTELDPTQEAMLEEIAVRAKEQQASDALAIGDRVQQGFVIGTVTGKVTKAQRAFIEVKSGSLTMTVPAGNLTKLPTLRFKQGDVVVRDCDSLIGHLATVLEDTPMGACRFKVRLDRRVPTTWDDNNSGAGYDPRNFRVATPADIAAFEARIPRPTPKFAVGDLAVITLSGYDDSGTYAVTDALERHNGMNHHLKGKPGELFRAEWLRPATDAEIAAYHKAHCAKVEPPKPTPVVVSNREHAGRRVRRTDSCGPYEATVVAPRVAAAMNPSYLKVNTVCYLLDDGNVTWSPASTLELLP